MIRPVVETLGGASATLMTKEVAVGGWWLMEHDKK